jgi:integrase/recombinase XerC
MTPEKTSSAPSDLFDHLDAWRLEPSLAFRSFLTSEEFAKTRTKGARPRRPDWSMGDESAGIYALMFQRFIDHLSLTKQSLPEARVEDVEGFFEGVLGSVSKETQKRYVRLIERVYDHLMNSSFIEANPVSEWVLAAKAKANAGSMPDSAPSSTEELSTDIIYPNQVTRLLEWLTQGGIKAVELDKWRDARDFTLAALGLGTGMRYFELSVLKREQVDYTPRHAEDRFAFDIKYEHTVKTSKAHRTHAELLCADLMEAWWDFRWRRGFRASTAPGGRMIAEGQYVFPAGLRVPKPKVVTGQPKTARNGHVGTLEKSSVFRALKEMAAAAVMDGVLDGSTRWVLERGAQGLRRAYVLNGLTQGSDSRTLTDRLGLWHKDSIKAYERDLDQAARRPRVGPA